ncbi:hypothetical protein [Fervidobacterium sp.]
MAKKLSRTSLPIFLSSTPIFVLIVLITVFSQVFALDIASSKELYKTYFSPSSEFHNYVLKHINSDLPLYRFFKIYMVGSTERAETTKKTGDYLEVLKPMEGVQTDEEKLARVMYLSYWEAKLNNRKFEVELIKSSPIFNEFFTDYQGRLVQAFGNYAQDLAAYLFGADITLDLVPSELESLRKEILGDYIYEPVYNGEEREAIALIVKEPDVIKSLSAIITEAQKSAGELDSEMLIMRTRGTIFRSSFGLIAGLKGEIAKEFIKVTPVEQNWSWIRWIVYLLVFVVWYFAFKNIKIPLTLMIAVETVYIGVFFNIQSTVDGVIYGMVFAITLLFSIFYFLSKKDYVLFALSFVTLVVIFLPSVSTKNLLMPDTFSSSPFYESLISEVLEEPLSKIQKRLKDYNTLINESVNKFSTVLNDAGVDSFDLDEEFFTSEGFYKRIEYVNKLIEKTKDSNLLKELNDFIYFEKERSKKVDKIISEFKDDFVHFNSIASEDFRNKLINFIDSKFQGSHHETLKNAIVNSKRKSSVVLPTYKISYSLSAIILLGLSLFLTALRREEAFVPLVGSFAVSILTLLKTQNIFIQVGVPMYGIYVDWIIPYTLILSVSFGIYWLYKNHIILRRRERV